MVRFCIKLDKAKQKLCIVNDLHPGVERFSFECRKTKTKVITLANNKEHRQYSEPIKTRSNYM